MTEAAAGALEITFVPDLAEHLRARQEMARIAPIFDPRGALPLLLALVLLAGLIEEVVGGRDAWAALGRLAPALFFLGVGLRMRRAQGRPVTWVVEESGIEVRQPRRSYRIDLERVRRVAETDEFFLLATAGAVFYLPKRALRASNTEAELRARLRAPLNVETTE